MAVWLRQFWQFLIKVLSDVSYKEKQKQNQRLFLTPKWLCQDFGWTLWCITARHSVVMVGKLSGPPLNVTEGSSNPLLCSFWKGLPFSQTSSIRPFPGRWNKHSIWLVRPHPDAPLNGTRHNTGAARKTALGMKEFTLSSGVFVRF